MNSETEGVIKFHLDYRDEPLKDYDITALSVWRMILKQLGLLGQQADRYDGYGFGNVSLKCADGFLISGTQTGALDSMKLENYALCESWDLSKNEVVARGSVKPSSESLSHASIYDVHPEVTCALHVHSPDLWRHAGQLGIGVTDPGVAYGTPEMAIEVRNLIKDVSCPGIFSMGGHEDGIFTFGYSLEDAGQLMIRELVRARSIVE